jgi:hypothetical protein
MKIKRIVGEDEVKVLFDLRGTLNKKKLKKKRENMSKI